MRFSLSLAAIGLLASSALGADSTSDRMAVVKSKRATAGPTDVEILNYALTLEYLERDFYAEGLAKFNKVAFRKAGYPAYIRQRFEEIAAQEKTHVAYLAEALGSAGVGECKYNFGLDSVDTFLAISRILEGVGTSAYLGAAPDITTKAYLAAAGAILTVEARHSSFLNEATGITGFPQPYDAALTYSQVYSLAAPFIIPGSCGSSGTLPPGIHAYPKLIVKTAGPEAGHRMGLHFAIPTGYTGPYYAVFINGLTQTAVKIDQTNGVTVAPPPVKGATYVVVSKEEVLSDASTIAGPAIIIF